MDPYKIDEKTLGNLRDFYGSNDIRPIGAVKADGLHYSETTDPPKPGHAVIIDLSCHMPTMFTLSIEAGGILTAKCLECQYPTRFVLAHSPEAVQ